MYLHFGFKGEHYDVFDVLQGSWVLSHGVQGLASHIVIVFSVVRIINRPNKALVQSQGPPRDGAFSSWPLPSLGFPIIPKNKVADALLLQMTRVSEQ